MNGGDLPQNCTLQIAKMVNFLLYTFLPQCEKNNLSLNNLNFLDSLFTQ